MSMYTDVIAFRSDKDKTYQKHKKVLLACLRADIEKLPKETAEYFDCEYPDKELLQEALTVEIPLHDYSEDMEEGYEILVSEIPEGVYKIRFYNSY